MSQVPIPAPAPLLQEAGKPPEVALGWPSQAWRFLLALLLSLVFWSAVLPHQLDKHPTLLKLDIGAGIVAFVAAGFRRRWPLTVALLTAALSAVSSLAGGPWLLASVSLATRRVWWQIALMVGVGLVGSLVFYQVQHVRHDQRDWTDLALTLLIVIGSLGWGAYIGSRRDLIFTLHQRAERAEQEQDLRVSQAKTDERTRIAREMHDVVAHRISRISMQSGALSYRTDLEAGTLRDGVREIQGQANLALNELREVLGLLRADSDTPARRPLPGHDDLQSLVDEARAAQMSIEFYDGLSQTMPEKSGRTVYRIVQEGITNAHKHAPGAVLRITLSGDPESGISLTMRNPMGFGVPQAPGSGLGLIGLGERARLAGGYLRHEESRHDFVLTCWIPWES